MIIVLSKKYDVSTNEVIKWLDYYEAKWIRINGEDIDEEQLKLNINTNDISKSIIKIAGKKINLKKVNIVWFRRQHDFRLLKKNVFEKKNIHKGKTLYTLFRYLQSEINTVFFAITRFFDSNWLDKPIHTNLNKFHVLNLAKKNGLKIPSTLITNSKNEVRAFLVFHKKIITKPIFEVQIFEVNDSIFMPYTCLIDEAVLDNLENKIFPILVQEYLEKSYEIRAFYLDGNIYSMAIFSQNDVKTQVDFRNYNFKHPNRNVPFILGSTLKIIKQSRCHILFGSDFVV